MSRSTTAAQKRSGSPKPNSSTKSSSAKSSGAKSSSGKTSTSDKKPTRAAPAINESAGDAGSVLRLDVEPAEVKAPTQRPRSKRLRPRSRVGGVAPFVMPQRRVSRLMALRRLERRGLVPLTPGRPRLIHRILPRTVIGICFMLLALGVGAAFSGAAFYAYYDDRLAENEETVARFVEDFDEQFTDAAGAIDEMRVSAVGDIRSELAPLGEYVDAVNGVVNLPAAYGESVWLLETRGEDGRIVNGAAFAVAPQGDEATAFITSYSLIEASVTSPSPPIELVKDSRRYTAQLWSWDESKDLALVTIEEVVPPLELATSNQQVSSMGSGIFAMSGVGGRGSSAAPGILLDHSQQGLQHTVPVGTLFEGGPLLNGDGRVLGVATLSYQPFGIDPGVVLQAPDVAGMCVVLLACPADDDALDVDIVADEAEAPPANQDPLRPVEPDPEPEGAAEAEAEAAEATPTPTPRPTARTRSPDTRINLAIYPSSYRVAIVDGGSIPSLGRVRTVRPGRPALCRG